MGKVKSLSELMPRGKRILVRVDFNVPMEKGAISDDTRIQASLPTIRYLIEQGADKIVLMSHLGRPEGKTPSLSLRPIAERLSTLLGQKVIFLHDCIGPEIESAIAQGNPGDIFLLENLRFYPAEEKPKTDPSFVESLSRLGDMYVNDAFGTAHRAHSSTALIANYFSGKRAAGFLMMKEIEALGSHLMNPVRPFTAIIGGAKISTKLGVLSSLLNKVDRLFIGGAMSYTFMKARGIPVGKSLVEEEMIEKAAAIEREAKHKGVEIHFPIDIIAVQKIEENAPSKLIEISKEGIPQDYEGVDIGPQTIAHWAPFILLSKTLFWNGPLGVFEVAPFNTGTFAIASLISRMGKECFTVVGGGDSISALEKLHLQNAVSHASTGGGASLEFIEQGQLPGIAALEE